MRVPWRRKTSNEPVYDRSRYLPVVYGWADEEIVNDQILNLDGIGFDDAPLPPRKHDCWIQTRVKGSGTFPEAHRCACGALRWVDIGTWDGRNSTRDYLESED